MKKLFAVLFCSLVIAGYAFADEPSYEIDPVATANAPWKVGEKIIKEGSCLGEKNYRKFLGVTQSGLALVQNFYSSGKKFTNPFLIPVRNADKNTEDLCMRGMEGDYTVWYENGQKALECRYKDMEPFGLCRFWDKKGNLVGEKDYGDPKD